MYAWLHACLNSTLSNIIKKHKTNLSDITAAAKDTADMELRSGSWERKNWMAPKKQIQYDVCIVAKLGKIISMNFSRHLPPVTMYTMSQPNWTINCCGTTIHNPSFGPKAYCPRSRYRSNRVPGTHSWSCIINQRVYNVMHHDRTRASDPGPLQYVYNKLYILCANKCNMEYVPQPFFLNIIFKDSNKYMI